MQKKPTIIIFDQQSLFLDNVDVIQESYSTLHCSSPVQLFSNLKKYSDSIKIIIYCANFSLSDYKTIQAIKMDYVLPEFILLSQDYAIDIFTEIAKLGIFSIHNISIHHAILELDIHDILSENLSYKALLKKRLNHVLDIDLYITYKNLLENTQVYSKLLNNHLHKISSPTIFAQDQLHILLIEDNQPLSKRLCNWLSKHSITTCPAYTYQDALYLLKRHSFDLIILDLGLPDNHGSSLLQDIHSFKLTPPIILLTAYKDYDSLLSCMKEGAFEYITKPFNPDIFIKKVRDTLHFSQLRSIPFKTIT